MKREQRTAAEVRMPGDGRTVEAVVCVYNVIDDYSTRFRPGCFTESLQKRMPKMCWGHDWRDPIGRWVQAIDTPTELTLIGELDDFDAVPRARQAYAQFQSGTIDQFSVGFTREADEVVDPDEVNGQRGVTDLVKCGLDETSPVLVGAVPGTHLVGVRMALRDGARVATVDIDHVVELAKRKASGELSLDEAKAALEILAEERVEEPEPDDEVPPVEEPEAEPELEPEEMLSTTGGSIADTDRSASHARH